MTLHRWIVGLCLGALGALFVAYVLLSDTEVSRRAVANETAESSSSRPQRRRVTVRNLIGSLKARESAATASIEVGPLADAGGAPERVVGSWDGKPKYLLTEEERQTIGATPIGYFVSRQVPRWSVVQSALRARGLDLLVDRVARLKLDLKDAARPYAQYDAAELIERQRKLVAELEPLKLNFRMGEFGLSSILEINEDFVDDPHMILMKKSESEL